MRSRSDVLVPASAAAFGLVTWSLAHALTYALFAHTHAGADTFAHVPEGAGPPVVAITAFVLTSVAAAMMDAQRSPLAAWASRLQPGSGTAAVAPAAFVAVEAGEALVRGGETPPAALLLIGIVVHAVMGAVTPWLWNGFVRPAVRALLAVAVARPEAVAPGWPADVLGADRETTPLSPADGRGPPGRSRHLRSLPSCA